MDYELKLRLQFLFQKEYDQPQTQQPTHPEQINYRDQLLSWIIEHCETLRYSQRTKELTISYIDHYLSSHQIISKYLQLLALCAVYIAQKHEENQDKNSVTLKHYLYANTDSYTPEQMIELELTLISSLRWNLNLVTPSVYMDELHQYIETVNRDRLEDLITYVMLSNSFTQLNNYEIFLTALEVTKPNIKLDFVDDQLSQKINYFSKLLIEELKYSQALNAEFVLQQQIYDEEQKDYATQVGVDKTLVDQSSNNSITETEFDIIQDQEVTPKQTTNQKQDVAQIQKRIKKTKISQ